MSDNIPFEIQMEIIKKVYDIKSLIRFRSVSKPWKSFIDSSQFISWYGARHTQPHSRILSLSPGSQDELRYICLVDDDIQTFKVQEQEFAPFVVSPLLKQYSVYKVVGACHGLLCLYVYNKDNFKEMVVIWNPCIGKLFGIVVVFNDDSEFGFGVCPVTRDPTIVKILHTRNKPWHVKVFTLSSGVWNVIPCSKFPRESIELNESSQVVLDRFISWGAWEMTFDDDGEVTTNYMFVSFDLITKEFKVVDLPDTLTKELWFCCSLYKLRESLVVCGSINVDGAECCGVWVMEHDSSFRKLFTISAPIDEILGFSKSGEPIVETRMHERPYATLGVYDPCSKHIKNLEISGVSGSFFMGSYKESLLLLDHLDSHIYYDNN